MPKAPKTNKEKKGKWLRRLKRIGIFFVLFIALFVTWFYFITKVEIPVCEETENTALEREQISPTEWTHGSNRLVLNTSGMYEMYLEGNPYEIGISHGKLTKELNFFQEKAFVNQIKIMVPSNFVLNKLKYFIGFFNRNLGDHISDEYKQEIYGVSRFASDSFDFIAPKYHRMLNYHAAHDIGHAVQDKNLNTGCTSFIIKGKKTQNGNMLLGRNFDFYSGDSFAKNKIVCFVHPDKGYNYAYVTWAGFTGVVSGMNDKGLCVTINAAKSTIPNAAKTPISILVKEILQYAANLKDAEQIARKRETFVSESILISSASDQTGIIIEKSPDKLGIVKMDNNELICPNHFQSKTFEKDEANLMNIKESSSMYRLERMKQLLAKKDSLTPEDAANILRNRFGKDDQNIGMGNEKNINQLICHHAVVMDPENLKMYVSTNPYNLGSFLCYNLQDVFKTKLAKQPNHISLIKADTFLNSQDYKNYIHFNWIKNHLPNMKAFDEEIVNEMRSLNPEYYHTYVLLANYCMRFNKFAEATSFFKTALKKEIATKNEKDYIEEGIKQCNSKIKP